MEEELRYIGSGNTHFLKAGGQRSDIRIWLSAACLRCITVVL